MHDVFSLLWAATQGLLLMAICVLLYQVVQQQGRLLLRLDRIEEGLGLVGTDSGAGLEVGAAIPEFHLPDLDGRMMSSEELRGRRTLLVHWGPNCGFCELIAPDLARLGAALAPRNTRLILASRDGADANRVLVQEHDLGCPILLMDGRDGLTSQAFRHQGTPVAYLLDDQARVAQPLLTGGDAILDAARQIAGEPLGRSRLPGEKPLSQSRLVRDGLPLGTPAPVFRLPDLGGATVDLAEHRGRRVLLIFTDPQCGPCEQLAPHLVRIQDHCRDHGLDLILVGRGDLAENRRKAELHRFEFPVVLQDRWKLSKEYGIFAVPVGFLIDEDGVIAANVAQGVEPILALAHQGAKAQEVFTGGSARR